MRSLLPPCWGLAGFWLLLGRATTCKHRQGDDDAVGIPLIPSLLEAPTCAGYLVGCHGVLDEAVAVSGNHGIAATI